MCTLRFGTSGIRGIFGSDVTIIDVPRLCRALEKVIGRGVYGVGYDTRKGCQALAMAVKAGMSWSGCGVIDFGLVPTPVLAFSIKQKNLKAGIMATASHNPARYAGIKLLDEHGKSLPASVEEKIESIIQEVSPAKPITNYGTITSNERAICDYVDTLLRFLPPSKRLFSILVDCGNGAASNITPILFKRLGHRALSIHSHPSWRFTGRGTEPTVEALLQTSKMVKNLGLDFGIANDGDADRLVLVDGKNGILPDHVLSTLMLKVIAERRKGDIVVSVNTSNVVESFTKKMGCQVTRTSLGKTADLLYQLGGVFATEPSKIVDPVWGYWEDGIYGAAAIVQYLSSKVIELSEFVRDVPYSFCRQVNLDMVRKSYGGLRKMLLSYYRETTIKEVQEIDGIRINFPDNSWLLFRISGTEPKVRLYVEAREEKRGRFLLDEAVNLVRSAN